mmetsp:Transcript_89146/g.133649  ORF Transcript_89146/g.133649 Transcript_89146/m.133649 type:complete len:101 (+) Transcript_89146:316-618(+)
MLRDQLGIPFEKLRCYLRDSRLDRFHPKTQDARSFEDPRNIRSSSGCSPTLRLVPIGVPGIPDQSPSHIIPLAIFCGKPSKKARKKTQDPEKNDCQQENL